MSTINKTIIRIGSVQISREKNDSGSWLLKVPQAAITMLNKSTALAFGTSFDHGKSVTLWAVGGGTWAGVAGTNVGIFVGTGII